MPIAMIDTAGTATSTDMIGTTAVMVCITAIVIAVNPFVECRNQMGGEPHAAVPCLFFGGAARIILECGRVAHFCVKNQENDIKMKLNDIEIPKKNQEIAKNAIKRAKNAIK